ncbi:MAG: hypothetical protein ABFR63_10575, partial [Thermodesulfobacteriota bacterium]
QLLEINYSEKYDTFTGYLANGSDYFRFEVDREKVELTPIDEAFEDHEDFIGKITGRNPQASFLVDPIQVREINYRDLESYKRLALATRDRQSGRGARVWSNALLLLGLLLLLAGILYYAYTANVAEEDAVFIPVLPGRAEVAVEEEIHYFFKIQLVGGGSLEGSDLKRDREKVLITNRQGLEVMMKLSAVDYIEKIQQDNHLSRSVIYGRKP